MGWFYRAVQDATGAWTCRHGRFAFDTHESLDEALRHLMAIAGSSGDDVEYFVHEHGGRILRGREPEALLEPAHLIATRPVDARCRYFAQCLKARCTSPCHGVAEPGA